MPKQYFAHVRTWVFDLDNTLYPKSDNLFGQIEDRMNAFIVSDLGISMVEAAALRERYWHEHGTTLAGLMAHHGADPDTFLAHVHDIDLSGLTPDPVLRDQIGALPGRKIIYTNGSRDHGRRVSAARGLGDSFDAIYGIEDADYTPKPRADAFARVFALEGLSPDTSAMFEDEARNLEVPHGLGMRTVLIGNPIQAAHIHHSAADLSEFLDQLT